MNAVEIEESITALSEQPFDAAEFPFAFLLAFGNKETTIKRLRSGASNKSDVGGILQTSNIHIKVAAQGETGKTLAALKASPATARAKARFVLATDGADFEAEDLETGETVACTFGDFPNHFGFFLPLAGITTVKQVRESSFDIRATSRLNRLYRTLLEENPDWDAAERRPEMNHFMARLIFCFFAEDTDIFNGTGLFTATIEQMSARDSSNTHEVIQALFRAMNTKIGERAAANLPRWADAFPYVNGELFSGSIDVPRFSKIARSYLLHIGNLDWTKINPDIFGSMIQAVADDEERGALGMHYTSVPNILKVLNPLFLDDLRDKLEEAGDNARSLLNLRKRMAKIRVFDPACGSGNFLVIAYKEMRAIEAEINRRRGEFDRRTEIPLTNFRGIELRDFPAEIARLALIIAEFQCDVLYRGQKEALAEFLPLDAQNWITCGNALRLDWLSVCPPTGTGVKLHGDDLFSTPLDQAQIDFENEGGETYICGNPPYLGNKLQSEEQKSDLQRVFEGRVDGWKSLDYVAGWLMKAVDYGLYTRSATAFVATNSICQGQQVSILWPHIFSSGYQVAFAHTSFKWSNLASFNAGVIVVIVGISNHVGPKRSLFSIDAQGRSIEKTCSQINAYLVDGPNIVIESRRDPPLGCSPMLFGNMPRDGGHLIVTTEERSRHWNDSVFRRYTKRFMGSEDFIQGKVRYCLWIEAEQYEDSMNSPEIQRRLEEVRQMRLESKASSTRDYARSPYRFVQIQGKPSHSSLIIPRHSSERRRYLPVDLLDADTVVADSAFALYDAPLWHLAIIGSRLHLNWVSAVCGKLKTDYRYSNTIGWNTFPIPILTERNLSDLERSAVNILLAREHYYPATIGDIYDPDRMESEFPLVNEAHQNNDEILERIYIGRRFRNDTERLEKLFDLFALQLTSFSNIKSRSSQRGGRGGNL
ncbi:MULTISPECIES: DNA methyltransferase [unclassified Chelatococcus]|uniref:class I SAM-dependent DNA methyltransferase n=1 Tax=unclassified Chelatococcus TaxID=2638111 RepID=UPI001BD09D71|nr:MULTISPECIES: DNA methyltransferase [unclassified Chelatococcus]CAH1652255.1 Type II restriction enzyme, methylase subunit YeeA [Hyphomicrobiales bacterium]MBS7739962.1 class I SAM-dependent DNA methyltransferase [Chelatococcus sp. HY11]MBX3545666.1 class I SAM-dependent DNA methyltransferase [Chelatococcus sp.]MCO5078738.1 lactate dehydrogenase [Chelatococcus sp.]CAH1686042.1 Type II restriction enzyme, methylase subunit YeeA [Hyphomicrobiales bacterium]